MITKNTAVSAAQEKILNKIKVISEDLIQAIENDGLTPPQMIKFVHRQTCELARIYHQLCHLHSEKEGNR
jgi:hypothetical protein